MPKNQNVELSMLEAVEKLIKRKVKPQKFSKIAQETFELMDVTDDLEVRTAQLYTDLSLSGKFVALGDDMWDLKSRQAFEVADYDTYDLDFEEVENPTPLLGEDVPAVAAILAGDSPVDDEEEEEEAPVSDDYSDESDAESKNGANEDHAGLSIYKEEEME